jgi:twitching motility two-component system response regulator PilH
MAVQKVLVVDDSATDLAHIKNIVVDAGYRVVTATTGQEAVDKAISEKPDLIFMDIVMDDLDGYGACRTLAQNSDTKSIPIVFTTSKKQKADRLWAQMQGGKGYITKPYSADDIIDQLKTFT